MARGAPGFSLRAASAADLPRLAELIVGHPLFERYALTPAALERGLVAAHARGDGVIGAWVGGEPVGFAWWQAAGAFGRSPYLRLLVVAADATGAGFGAQLLDAVEVAAFATARDLFLLVTCENAAAQRLYRRHGFVAVGVLNDYVRPGVDELLMRKSRPEAPPLVPLTAG
jgi:ribosomal protein S18 acetylase RimI-like enzyme